MAVHPTAFELTDRIAMNPEGVMRLHRDVVKTTYPDWYDQVAEPGRLGMLRANGVFLLISNYRLEYRD